MAIFAYECCCQRSSSENELLCEVAYSDPTADDLQLASLPTQFDNCRWTETDSKTSTTASIKYIAAEEPDTWVFLVNIERCDSRLLGMDLRHYGENKLQVIRVVEGGLVDCYNVDCELNGDSTIVQSGDVIEEVNDVQDIAHQLLARLASEPSLKVLLRRGLPSVPSTAARPERGSWSSVVRGDSSWQSRGNDSVVRGDTSWQSRGNDESDRFSQNRFEVDSN